MRTKILLSVLLTMLLLALGCRNDKAGEKQTAANQQPTNPAPSSDTAAQPPPSTQSDAVKKPAPTPAMNPSSEASPASAAPSTPAETHTPAPTPTPTPTPAPTPIVLATGTAISIRTTSQISTNNSKANQEFEASLAKPVLSGNEVVIPKGTPVKGVILQADQAGRIKGEGGLILQLTSLTLQGKSYRLVTDHAMQQSKSRGKRSAAMIGGGGGAGALIGGLAGGGKGALIGALAGAGAGTAGATMTGNRDLVIPAETILGFKLTAPLTLPPGGTSDDNSGSDNSSSQPSPTQPPN